MNATKNDLVPFYLRGTSRCATRGSGMPKEGHFGLGQAKPSVFTRLGAPRRLFTSRQGRDIRRPSPRRGSGGETTGGASVWAAGREQTMERSALGPSS